MIDALLHKSIRPTARSASAPWIKSSIAVASPTRMTSSQPRLRNRKARVLPRSARGTRQAQTKYKLVVLSNGDPDMLESAKTYHKIPSTA